MASALENIQSPRPTRRDSALLSADSLSPTMTLPSSHWNSFNQLPIATENSSDSDDELNLESGDTEGTGAAFDALTLGDLNKGDYQQKNPDDEQAETEADAKMQNASLMKQVEELNEKIIRFEAQTKRLENEKKADHREHKKQISRLRKKVKTLSDNLRSKEESVIPGFMKRVEEKELALDECRKNLTAAQQETTLLIEKLGKCTDDLSRTSEERDIVTTELKGHICDTGRITNEMSEVLSVRENMAKQYYQEKCKLLNQIEILQIESRRKQHLIDRLIARVEVLERQLPRVAVVGMQDPFEPRDEMNRDRNAVSRWCYDRFGVLWPAQVAITIFLLILICTLTVLMVLF